MSDKNPSIHPIIFKSLQGQDILLEDFKGRKLLIVNTASECGYTPQYAQLQELHEHFKDQIAIIGCPSNEFGNQEPGDAEAIGNFCQKNYGVRFLMSEKLCTTGENQHPLYTFLCSASENGKADYTVEWNFHKFLLDEDGVLINSFPSAVSPLDEAILNHLNH